MQCPSRLHALYLTAVSGCRPPSTGDVTFGKGTRAPRVGTSDVDHRIFVCRSAAGCVPARGGREPGGLLGAAGMLMIARSPWLRRNNALPVGKLQRHVTYICGARRTRNGCMFGTGSFTTSVCWSHRARNNFMVLSLRHLPTLCESVPYIFGSNMLIILGTFYR